MKTEEITELLNEIEDVFKELTFVKFTSLFAADATEKKLAQILQKLGAITVSLKTAQIPEIVMEDVVKPGTMGEQQGELVMIRPCDPTLNGKTYLGFYLGDLPIGTGLRLEKNNTLKVTFHHNPAIFVPQLGRIVYGCESWWGPIRSEDDLKQITDADINDVWYVKLSRNLGLGSPVPLDQK
jgi:hypothetical protein